MCPLILTLIRLIAGKAGRRKKHTLIIFIKKKHSYCNLLFGLSFSEIMLCGSREFTVALSCLSFLAIVVAQLEQVLQNDVERYGDDSLDSHACDCNIAKHIISRQSGNDDRKKFSTRERNLTREEL